MTATLAIITGKTPFYVSHQDIICHFQFTKTSSVFFSSRMNEKESRPHLFCSQKMSRKTSILCVFTEKYILACFPTILSHSLLNMSRLTLIIMNYRFRFSSYNFNRFQGVFIIQVHTYIAKSHLAQASFQH